MLREAHRERQEKIRALQTQLQCKNLTALMYVMCTERRRSRIEKLNIIKGIHVTFKHFYLRLKCNQTFYISCIFIYPCNNTSIYF